MEVQKLMKSLFFYYKNSHKMDKHFYRFYSIEKKERKGILLFEKFLVTRMIGIQNYKKSSVIISKNKNVNNPRSNLVVNTLPQ